jgi:hypothetical protein
VTKIKKKEREKYFLIGGKRKRNSIKTNSAENNAIENSNIDPLIKTNSAKNSIEFIAVEVIFNTVDF